MYKAEIDFDEASKEWRKNKVRQPNGCFRYKCSHFSTSKQQLCKNKVVGKGDYCIFHRKQRLRAGL